MREEKDFTFQQLEDYLQVIRWDLKDKHLEGLELFYKKAHTLNLINHVPKLSFADVKRR